MSEDYKHVPTSVPVVTELVEVKLSVAESAAAELVARDSDEESGTPHDSKAGSGGYLELTLSLNSPDKLGVAWQLGALMALQKMSLLRHVRHVDASGMSNLMVAQWINGAVWINDQKWSTSKWDTACSSIKDALVSPVINHLLLVDQERSAIWKRMIRPWQWFEGWNRAFGMWLEEWMPETRLFDVMKSVETTRAQQDLPIFTLSAFDTSKQKTLVMTTEKEPIRTGDDEAGVYPRCFNYSEVDPISFLIGSAVGAECMLELAPKEWAVIDCALPVDPMVSKPSDMHWIGYRAPVTAGLDSGRRIVLDAYTHSHASHGSVQSAFTESTSSNLTMIPVSEREAASDDFKTPAALYQKGYLRMHSNDANVRGLGFLKDGAKSHSGMLALTKEQVEHYVNWGWAQTLSRFGSRRLAKGQFPFPACVLDGML